MSIFNLHTFLISYHLFLAKPVFQYSPFLDITVPSNHKNWKGRTQNV